MERKLGIHCTISLSCHLPCLKEERAHTQTWDSKVCGGGCPTELWPRPPFRDAASREPQTRTKEKQPGSRHLTPYCCPSTQPVSLGSQRRQGGSQGVSRRDPRHSCCPWACPGSRKAACEFSFSCWYLCRFQHFLVQLFNKWPQLPGRQWQITLYKCVLG